MHRLLLSQVNTRSVSWQLHGQWQDTFRPPAITYTGLVLTYVYSLQPVLDTANFEVLEAWVCYELEAVWG